MKKLFTILGILAVLSAIFVFAAKPNPGHDATEISGGTFSANDGDFIFPASVDVGVGASPTSKLHVIGDNKDIRLSSADFDIGALTYSTTDDGAFVLKSSGTNKVFIDSAGDSFLSGGNVGIGTTSPVTDLEVETSAAGTGTIQSLLSLTTSTDGTEDDGMSIDFRTNVVLDGTERISARIASQQQQVASSHYGDLSFWTMSIGTLHERMRITEAGNVGIGTTGPGAPLQVDETTASNSEQTALIVKRHYSGGALTDWTGPYIDFVQEDQTTGPTTFARIGGLEADGSGTDNDGDLVFQTATSGTPTVKMVLDNDGNLGIGTTNPDAKLHLTLSDATTFTAGDMGAWGPETHGLYIHNSDGTAGAYSGIQLHTGTSARMTGFIGLVDEDGSGGSTGRLFLGTRNAGGNIYERIVIDEGGRVGIGTTSPESAYGLDVVGSTALDFAYISDSMQLKPRSSSPGTCNPSFEGAVYYDADPNELCFCDGSGWYLVASPTTSC